MIQGQLIATVSAVLTGVSISVEDIAASQGNFFIGNLNVMAQPNYRRQGKPSVDILAIVFYLFCFVFN